MSNFMSHENTPAVAPVVEAQDFDQAARNEAFRSPGVTTIQADGSGNISMTKERMSSISGKDFAGDTQGVLASARTPMGMPILSSEITDDTMLTVQGIQMRAIDAARLGFCERLSATEYDYSEGYEASVSEAKSQEPGETVVTGSFISDELAQGLGRLEQKFGANTIKAGLLSAGAALVSKDANKARVAVERFASSVSMEPKEANDLLSFTLSDLLGRISATTASVLNVGNQEVVDFMRSLNPEIKSQLVVRGIHGDTSLVKDLASRYRQNRKN
jgi:hypothetical protein